MPLVFKDYPEYLRLLELRAKCWLTEFEGELEGRIKCHFRLPSDDNRWGLKIGPSGNGYRLILERCGGFSRGRHFQTLEEARWEANYLRNVEKYGFLCEEFDWSENRGYQQ